MNIALTVSLKLKSF